MKRRSFLSVAGAAGLLRMPLHAAAPAAARPWGPPEILYTRGEHERAVVSFTPVEGAQSYSVRCQPPSGAATVYEGILVSDYTVHGLKNGQEYVLSVAATGSRGLTGYSAGRSARPAAEMDWASLERAFTGPNPTRSSCPFWMLHGSESDDELRRSLEAVHRFGFEGVTLHPYDYQDFLGEGHWRRWKTIVEHARKLGLVVWQQDDKNYPSGYAAGSIVAKDRRLARWEIVLAHQVKHRGPAPLQLDTAGPLGRYRTLVSVSAFGPQGRIEDLGGFVKDGRLSWEAPEGDWEVFVTAAWQPGVDDPKGGPNVVRGEVRGYIDPLSPEATGRYVEAIQGATYARLGAEFGRTWRGFFIDEPGFYSSGSFLGTPGAGYPFTPDFLPRFEQRHGYKLAPLLPLLWLNRGPQTASVRYDYMDFVSTEYARLFMGKLTEFAEAHGVQIAGHVMEHSPYQLGTGTGSNFRTLEHFSMGGFDSIFDQWYQPDEDVYWRQPKMASSVSHYNKTPLDEAVVEHFAATGWRTGLTEMKAMMDWTTCRGLNRVVPCGLDTQDPPVWEVAPEFWLHGANPLAPYFPTYQAAANRETMMIRGGRHVASALVLDPAESVWAGAAEPLWRVVKMLSHAHFDYDIVSYRVFSDPARCRIGDARLALGNEEYAYVILPGVDAIPLAVVRRLLEFYEAGGCVIVVGAEARFAGSAYQFQRRLPFRSADARHDDEVRETVERIWGKAASGHGRAFLKSYKDISGFLYSLDDHDVWIEPQLPMLQCYHRRLSGRDLYFFNNEGAPAHTTVRLRGAAGTPELWDPVSGAIRQAPCYRAEPGGLRLRLDLEHYESVFAVVNPAARPLEHLEETNADEAIRRPDGRIEIRKGGGLLYWVRDGKTQTTMLEPALPARPIPGWSGPAADGNAAVYRAEFSVDADMKAELRVEEMTQVVSLKLDGRDRGTHFCSPFRFNLGVVPKGLHRLELRHVERHGFESRLGRVRLSGYRAVEI